MEVKGMLCYAVILYATTLSPFLLYSWMVQFTGMKYKAMASDHPCLLYIYIFYITIPNTAVNAIEDTFVFLSFMYQNIKRLVLN